MPTRGSGEALPALQSPFVTIFSFVNVSQIISVVFLVLFLIWLVYTIISAYHLLRYGHRSSVTIPALIVHLIMSGFLALYSVSGLH